MKKYLTLNTDDDIPILGLGTWKLRGTECQEAVRAALTFGYQHFDTAAAYGNHRDIATALNQSGIDRQKYFITSKVSHTHLAHDDVIASCHKTLEELEMDYINLYLVHWPNLAIPIKSTLRAMQDLKDEGYIRAYGVSNFTIHDIEQILSIGDSLDEPIQISMNQIEIHPSFQQQELTDYCQKNNIAVTAYSPFAQGQDLHSALIDELARKYDRSPAQIILNWIIQKEIVVIPKASSLEHIEDNIKALEWDMDPDDMELIDSLRLKNSVVL